MIPTKPEKPTKKIAVKHSVNYDFDWASKKVSFDGFLAWAKEQIPRGADDVTLELVEHWEYDDVFTYLQIAWKQTEDNPNYDKQMKKYEKSLAKWKKEQCQK